MSDVAEDAREDVERIEVLPLSSRGVTGTYKLHTVEILKIGVDIIKHYTWWNR